MLAETETWTSRQFRRAAEAHLNACNYMLTNIDNAKLTDKPNLYFEIYYISGYIIECMLKHAILESKHKKHKLTKKELKELGLWEHSIYDVLWTLACDELNIPKNQFLWNDLTKKWKHEIRYEFDNQDFKNPQKVLAHYNETVVGIYNEIKSRY